MANNESLTDQSGSKVLLNKRLEDFAWGLFLLMIGGILLVPDDRLPHGTWLIGAGAIMLALNVVRYLNGIRTSVFTTVLGIFVMIAGFASLSGVKVPFFAILLVLVGGSLMLKSLFTTRT